MLSRARGMQGREALLARLAAGARPGGGCIIALRLRKLAAIAELAGAQAAEHVVDRAAERIAELSDPGDFLADLGEGTFAILAAAGEREAEAQAERLIGGVSRDVPYGETVLFASANAGICPLGDAARDPADSLERAMGALQHAMSRGPGALEVVSEARVERALEQWEMSRLLEEAALRGEFRLEFQAIHAADGSDVRKLEALLRWQSPALGRVGPDRFIPMLEESGLIRPVGEWVLRQACGHLCDWRAQTGLDLCVAVNVSPVQMASLDFESDARRVLAESRCEPGWIELEFTEGAVVRDFDRVRGRMEALTALGFTLAIDDFGAGYSSLGQLGQLPVHHLKMDRSLIAGLPDGGKRSGIVKAVAALAEALGMGITAEGVETPEQAAWLAGFAGMRCQGYLFSRPMPPDRVPALLAATRAPRTPSA
jgi:EAL domain-containing protein (putative c-di-GMP-specific phosphodiesterase class I)/GGDEF domain-containing protein